MAGGCPYCGSSSKYPGDMESWFCLSCKREYPTLAFRCGHPDCGEFVFGDDSHCERHASAEAAGYRLSLVEREQFDAILPFLDKFEESGFSEAVEIDFVQILYANDWVTPEVDWVQWQDVAVEYVDLPEKINSADVVTIKKLFTTHVRKDRFCEGHLNEMFKNGHIVALLRRLKEIRETTPDTTEERNEVRRAKTLKVQLEALRGRR